MKPFIVIPSLLLILLLAGCAVAKPRDFFAKDGIVIGAPVAMDKGRHRIPLRLTTAIVHSAWSLHSVRAKVKGNDILVTGRMIQVNAFTKYYPHFIEVKGLSPGTYTLKYRDPKGPQHVIGTIEIP